MTKSPEIITNIIAVVPHESNPDRHLVDSDGRYPTAEHTGGETFEDTFRRMGIRKLGLGSLSVAAREYDLEGPDDIAYRAKPTARDPHPDSGYFWKNIG